jgi:hypothetical protein
MKKHTSEEDISCLVDGELGEFRSRAVLKRLESSPEVRERWENYCMIGDVMRRAPVLASDEHFADQIAEQLRSEPTVLAPARWRRGVARGAYWGGGLALAASVMAVAVFVYQDDSLSPIPGVSTEVASATDRIAVPQRNLSRDRDLGIQAIRPIPAAETGQGTGRYAGMQTDSTTQVRTARPVYYWEAEPRARNRYNSYLAKHNQYASRQGGAGFVNYARVVSADHEPVLEQQADVQ